MCITGIYKGIKLYHVIQWGNYNLKYNNKNLYIPKY